MELYRHLACALYLVYGVGDVGVLYVCFVGCVVEYQRVVLEGVVHPFAQFFLGYHRAGGVVGIAQVYYVDAAVWYLRNKVVFGRARHVYHVAPLAVVHCSRAAYHHIRVDVYGIDGVGHTDAVVPAYEFLDVAGVAFCSVVDENLVGIKMYAPGRNG